MMNHDGYVYYPSPQHTYFFNGSTYLFLHRIKKLSRKLLINVIVIRQVQIEERKRKLDINVSATQLAKSNQF